MTTRDLVWAYLRSVDHSPSVREIGQAVGLKSPATVQYYLAELERGGLIDRHGPERRISVRSAA